VMLMSRDFHGPRCLLFALLVLSSLSETAAHLVQHESEETQGGNLSPLVASAAPLHVPARIATPGALPITPRTSSPAMQLPDLGKMAEDAAGAVTKGAGDVMSKMGMAAAGLSDEEAKAMEERLKAGEMSFDDFLTQVKVMQKGAGLQDMMGKMGANKQGLDLAAGRKRLEKYGEYIEAMDPEERSGTATQTLIDEAEAGRSGSPAPRLERIADATGTSLEDVGKFVLEFSMMRSAAVKFANGESPESIQASMEREQMEKGPPLNRQQRRMNAKKRKKGRAKASGFGR